jgi:hypothetical protein
MLVNKKTLAGPERLSPGGSKVQVFSEPFEFSAALAGICAA